MDSLAAGDLAQNYSAWGTFLLTCGHFLRPGLVLVVLVAAAGGTLARASVVRHRPVRLAPASQVVLGSSFQPSGAMAVVASGDYVALSTTSTDGGWIVLNQRTGTGPRSTLSAGSLTSVLRGCC